MKSLLLCVAIVGVFTTSRAESEAQACTYDGNRWICRSTRNPDGGPVGAFGSTDGQNNQVYAGQGFPPGSFVPNFPSFPGFPGFPFQNGFQFGRR
ncbi:hypothetical protein HNY73_004885 [Argiope bruennichi]|uniref:Secreted protein n=1 Tax=Argiope bruennichi TaxID=94029 RepID=A0A8T0FS04_ARGBR|nr:hypothetical protein HNY73_004885 [Argiope bruennichi]